LPYRIFEKITYDDNWEEKLIVAVFVKLFYFGDSVLTSAEII